MTYNEQMAMEVLKTPAGQRALTDLKLKDSQSAAQAALTPTFQRGNNVTTLGGETQAAVSVVDTGILQPFTIQYTAPTSGGKWVIIGNPGNLVSNGLSINSADIADYGGSGSVNTYEELKEYARGGFTISSINYQVSDATQFAQRVLSGSRSVDGSIVSKQLNGLLVASLNPMNNLSNVRILNLSGGQALINRDNALLFYVEAGTEITLAIATGGVRS